MEELTPEQLAYIRAAHARARMDEAGPQMLETLKKSLAALEMACEFSCSEFLEFHCGVALESVRAAIAAAE